MLNYLKGERDKISREVIHTYKIDYLLGKVYIKFCISVVMKDIFKENWQKLQNNLKMLPNP